MPLTTLDDLRASFVIDLQKGVAGMAAAHPASEMIDRAAQLAQDFRKRGLPVVLAVDGMTDRGADAHRYSVEKISPGWARRPKPMTCYGVCDPA